MRVRIKEAFAEGGGSGFGVTVYHVGQVLEVGDETGASWMALNRAERLGSGEETAVMPERGERAVRSSRRRGKA